jgi:hypothetical protein
MVSAHISYPTASGFPKEMGGSSLTTVLSSMALGVESDYRAITVSGEQLGVLTCPTSCDPRQSVCHDRIPPSLVCGRICEFWVALGDINPTQGYLLTDPQFLSDGTTCVIFEGSHGHQASGSEDATMFVKLMHICLQISNGQ